MTTRTTIDIHALQTVPPSNINRDDTGSPKTAIYGGTRRARVSSQSWKRAIRTAFGDLIAKEDLGIRTKKVVELVAAQITAQDESLTDRSMELAEDVLRTAGFKVSKPKGAKAEGSAETEALAFLSSRQIVALAELAVGSNHSGKAVVKKDAQQAASRNSSVDITMFGRMVASEEKAHSLNVDATVQVAHAISVHPVESEFDYFTAIDDLSLEGNTGAGMIGTVEFNSSTLYRYATVNVDELHKGLGEATATSAAVAAFVRAFITSMPTGKQNTFANRTLPEAVVVFVRDGQSVNLAGAFEEAIITDNTGGRLRVASTRLVEYAKGVDSTYSQSPIATYVLRVGPQTAPLNELGDEVSLDELVERVSSLVAERVQESE